MGIREHRGYTYHDLISASTEELEAAVWLRREQTPGVYFARKMRDGKPKVRSTKNAMRCEVGVLYRDGIWPLPLRILTMPSVNWAFERLVIGWRSFPTINGIPQGLRSSTEFYCIERDPAVFRAAMQSIPAATSLRIFGAGAAIASTDLITHFECAEFEKFGTETCCPFFDAAWLDLTGPLTPRFMHALRHFWEWNCGHQITVTFLRARESLEMTKQIRAHGSHTRYLSAELDAHLVRSVGYHDPVPMQQVTLRKRVTQTRYLGLEHGSYEVPRFIRANCVYWSGTAGERPSPSRHEDLQSGAADQRPTPEPLG